MKFSKLPLFDQLALEGAACFADRQLLNMMHAAHNHTNSTGQVYLADRSTKYYFDKSGRNPLVDWGIGADFSNLTPPEEAFFIEFNIPHGYGRPEKAGVLFVIQSPGEPDKASFDIKSVTARAKQLITDKLDQNPSRGNDSAWWQTLTGSLGTADLDLIRVLWTLRPPNLEWWYIAFPYLQLTLDQPIAGPVLAWHFGVTKSGRIFEGPAGALFGVTPVSQTPLPNAPPITETHQYQMGMILKPALFALHLLNQDSTTLIKHVPPTVIAKQARRQRGYTPVSALELRPEPALAAFDAELHPESVDTRRLTERLRTSATLSELHQELFSVVPVLIADELANYVYTVTDQEQFDFRQDFAAIKPPLETDIVFVEMNRPPKVISEKYAAPLPSDFLPQQWGFLFHFIDVQNISVENKTLWTRILAIYPDAKNSRWLLTAQFASTRDLETLNDLEQPTLDNIIAYFILNDSGSITLPPLLEGCGDSPDRQDIGKNMLLPLTYPALMALSLANCLNAEIVDYRAKDQESMEASQYLMIHELSLEETLTRLAADDEAPPNEFLYFQNGRVHTYQHEALTTTSIN